MRIANWNEASRQTWQLFSIVHFISRSRLQTFDPPGFRFHLTSLNELTQRDKASCKSSRMSNGSKFQVSASLETKGISARVKAAHFKVRTPWNWIRRVFGTQISTGFSVFPPSPLSLEILEIFARRVKNSRVSRIYKYLIGQRSNCVFFFLFSRVRMKDELLVRNKNFIRRYTVHFVRHLSDFRQIQKSSCLFRQRTIPRNLAKSILKSNFSKLIHFLRQSKTFVINCKI